MLHKKTIKQKATNKIHQDYCGLLDKKKHPTTLKLKENYKNYTRKIDMYIFAKFGNVWLRTPGGKYANITIVPTEHVPEHIQKIYKQKPKTTNQNKCSSNNPTPSKSQN